MFKGYFNMDLKRILLSMRWLWGAIGICAVMQFSLPQMEQSDVLSLFQVAFSSELLTLNFVFGAFPYAASICEDFERKYIRLEIQRGDIWNYVVSKTLICFIMAVFTTVLGVMFFAILNSLTLPFIGDSLTSQSNIGILKKIGMFGSLLIQKKYYLYFLLSGIQFGLLSGALSICAMFSSLFFKNRIIVYAVPSIIYYLFINYIAVLFNPPRMLSIHVIFNATYDNVWKNDALSFLWAFCIALLAVILGMAGIMWGLKRRLEYE